MPKCDIQWAREIKPNNGRENVGKRGAWGERAPSAQEGVIVEANGSEVVVWARKGVGRGRFG